MPRASMMPMLHLVSYGYDFVPSIGGVSSPDEETTDDMCYNGLNVLTETMGQIDEKKSI